MNRSLLQFIAMAIVVCTPIFNGANITAQVVPVIDEGRDQNTNDKIDSNGTKRLPGDEATRVADSNPGPAEEPARFTEEQIDFFETKKVRPLLVENCFECHSSDAKKLQGGLKLDSRAAAIKGGDTGAGLIPGDADKSLIIDAVRWKQFEMPPRGKLAAEHVDTLSKWVSMGAPWPVVDENTPVDQPIIYDWPSLQSQHWAWQKVQRQAAPVVKNPAWVKSEIDQFVLAKLEGNGLAPASPANPRTLIRRFYFDLIGLPPTPTQIEEFVASSQRDREASLAAMIEELLASRHYGERWGRHWLDVARYSDGFGGSLDGAGLPNAWRYRDWVVEALNCDMPIDQFIRMQIAGDQIDPPQAIATGFLALGPTYISDGGDPDSIAQAMSETLADRVDTLTRGLLGLTAACALCHDHKFDPIPQLDYYSIAEVFRNSKVRDYPLVPNETVKAFQNHQTSIQELEKKISKLDELARTQNRDPELLDSLTSEFMDKGWSLKQLYRLILTSSMYWKGGMSYGATDQFGYSAVENRVHAHDLRATTLHLMDLDHEKLTYRYSGRDYRLTDVHGNVVSENIA
jgi:hypothetical protein